MDFSDPEILGCTQFNTLLVGFNFRRLHIENFEARSSHILWKWMTALNTTAVV